MYNREHYWYITVCSNLCQCLHTAGIIMLPNLSAVYILISHRKTPNHRSIKHSSKHKQTHSRILPLTLTPTPPLNRRISLCMSGAISVCGLFKQVPAFRSRVAAVARSHCLTPPGDGGGTAQTYFVSGVAYDWVFYKPRNNPLMCGYAEMKC